MIVPHNIITGSLFGFGEQPVARIRGFHNFQKVKVVNVVIV